MKKILITLLQIAVTVGALWLIFKNPKNREAFAYAFTHAELRWVLAAIVAAGLSPVTATVRWWMLLNVQGIRPGWKRVTQLYMIGSFFNLFLLGSTGGDALKMFYLVREVGPSKRAGAILTVIVDRLLGLLALVALAVVFVTMRYSWLTRTKETTAILASFGLILGSAVAGLAVVFTVIGLRLVDRLPARLPGRSKFVDMAAACRIYAQAWRTTLLGIVISWAGHSSFFFTYYFAARAVHSTTVKLWDMTTLLPIINTIVAVPISVSGVGLREGLFTRLLGDLCGTPAGDAVAISFIGFLCSVLFYGLLGALFFLSYRSATGAPPPGMETVEETLAGDDDPAARPARR